LKAASRYLAIASRFKAIWAQFGGFLMFFFLTTGLLRRRLVSSGGDLPLRELLAPMTEGFARST
jgi:hypothetical protein